MVPARAGTSAPQIGVTDLRNKWVNQRGSLALGGGVTIGTVADNGFTFAGRFLLVIVFPGPILMIEGKANLLKERASLHRGAALPRAGRARRARRRRAWSASTCAYKYDGGGELIDIGGGAEAFFDFNDPSAWHLYLGQREPRERRIRAEHLRALRGQRLLHARPARSSRLGAWVGYDERLDVRAAAA